VFAVPVPRDSAVPLPVPGEGFVPPRLDRMDIRCIDDEPEVLDGMAALLAGWGARVEVAASAGGIAMRPGGWHAIIADHLLPGEPGLAILRRMAGMAPLRILLTATAPEGWEEILPAEGIVLLRKPGPPAELRAVLARSGAAV
jgi:CheY-like chemotaxis protein